MTDNNIDAERLESAIGLLRRQKYHEVADLLEDERDG